MTVVNDLRGAVTRASDEEIAAAVAANRTAGDDFSQGLRSGALSARGQLNKVAGVGMDALGFDGSGRNAAAAEDAAAAAEAGQGLLGVRDVGSLRDVGRFAAGTLGQMLPMAGAAVGAGVLAGGSAVPAMLAGTAATVPFELGGQLQRQDADPVAAALPADQRLAAALPGAVGAAALQNVVPAGVAGRLAGKGGQATAKQIIGRAAADVPANAVASAGAEMARQGSDALANPEARVNPDAVTDAAIEGAGAGALFGGVGALGHAAGSAGGAPGRLAGQAKSFVGSALDKAKTAAEGLPGVADKAKEAVGGVDLNEPLAQAKSLVGSAAEKTKAAAEGVDLGPVKDKVGSAADRVIDLAPQLRDSVSAGMKRVADGEEFFDPSTFAGKTEGALKAAIDKDGVLRNNAVTETAKKLWEDHGLTPEQRAQLGEAMTNLADGANQRIVAGMAVARQAGQAAMDSLSDVASRFRSRDEAGGKKLSADYTGANKVVADAIAPYLKTNLPELNTRRGLEELAPTLRSVLSQMTGGKQISVDNLLALSEATNGHAANLLERVRGAMGADKDPQKTLNYLNMAEQLMAVEKGRKHLLKTMEENYVGDPFAITPRVLDKIARHLVEWADDAKRADTPVKQAEARLGDARMRQALEAQFGKGTNKVLDAVEKLLPKPEENVLEKARTKVDEGSGEAIHTPGDESVLSDAIPDTKLNTLGAGKDGAGYLNAKDDPGKSGFRPAATTALEKAQAAAPGARFAHFGDELPLDHPAAQQRYKMLVAEGDKAGVDGEAYAKQEIGKYGAIVHETSNNPLAVTADELVGAKLDAKNFSRSASRIDAPGVGHAIDAVKLTEMFRKRTENDGATLVGQNGRDAKAFMDGMAAVQDYTGKTFEVPDDTVINKGGLTWGAAKQAHPDLMKGANDPRAKLYEQGLGELTKQELKAGVAQTEEALAPMIKSISVLKDTVKRLKHEGEGKVAAEAQAALDAARERAAPYQEKLRKYNGELKKREADDTAGAQELDPFGPTFQDGRTLDQATPGGINTDGGEARTPGAKAPSLLGVPPDPKVVAAKKAALTEKARSGDPELIKQLKTSEDAKGLQRAAEALTGDDANTRATLDAVNDRLRELVEDPDTAYGMQTKRYSMQPPDREAGPRNVKQAIDQIRQVLGNTVTIDAKANIPHAAEFERVLKQQGGVEDVIRLSVHSMNPLSGAFHESLHAFFAKLTDQKNGEIAGILEKAASSPTVMLRLRELLKDQPEALKQLDDPEERAAYMYQFHSMGENLGLGQPAQTLFGRVAEFVRSALGIWSNDQRALHIVDYFNRGEFLKNIGDGDKVYRDLMNPGRNKAVEQFKAMVRPISNLGEELAVAGHQRLRDTGIPALRELADLVKRQGTETGDDQGFIPAARQERAIRMNKLGEELHGSSPEALGAALEALQSGQNDAIKALKNSEDISHAMGAKRIIRAALDEAFSYMTQAGVKVNDLGVGKDYFPRVWDVNYISGHKAEFLSMLDKYVQSGKMKGDPQALLQRLLTSEGNEFTIETDRPGMQFLKPRELAFIEGADAARFLNKNLYETLNGYMTQATRRAEWARRLGDDGQVFGELLTKAEKQGAAPADLDAARKYMRAVDGTLGDTISPEFRRLQGNMMVYQNIRLLPLAVFSSMVDAGGIAVRGGTVGEALSAFKRGFAEIPKGFKKDATHDEATQLAATLGVIDSAALIHTLGTSFSQGMVGETGRKLNDTFFRLNLMEQYNSSMRVAATQAAIGFLGRHADGTHSEHSGRWLAELGLQPGEVQRDAKGRALVTEADGLTPEQAAKMKVAINRWVDGAVLRPDAADKPIWMSDPHFALVSHLKQFTFSFHETILKRVAHELSHGNMGPTFALASYVPIMMAADAAKGLLTTGGVPDSKKDWDAADYVQSGIERGGLLGVGQFGVDMLKDVNHGGTGVGALAGPTLEQLGEAVRTVGGRGEFRPFLLHAMPANALYAAALKSEPAEARVAD